MSKRLIPAYRQDVGGGRLLMDDQVHTDELPATAALRPLAPKVGSAELARRRMEAELRQRSGV